MHDDDNNDKVCMALAIIFFWGKGKLIWSIAGGRVREYIHLSHFFFFLGGGGEVWADDGGGYKGKQSLYLYVFKT